MAGTLFSPDSPKVQAQAATPVFDPNAQIWKDVKRLRAALGGLQARKNDLAPYPVKSAKELMMKFRRAVDEYSLVCYSVYAEQAILPKEKGCIVSICMTWRLQSLKDGSYLEVAIPTLGADTQDKATGKAITYGWKYFVSYLCSLPDADIKQVWDAGADLVDNDDKPLPTNEPKGISEVDKMSIINNILAAKTIDEYETRIAEMKATCSKITQVAVYHKVKHKRAELEKAIAESGQS